MSFALQFTAIFPSIIVNRLKILFTKVIAGGTCFFCETFEKAVEKLVGV